MSPPRRRRVSPACLICRVHASEVCRSWREATTCPALWRSLKFVLSCDDDEASAEAFLAWLLSRAAAVETLHIDIQDSAVGAACCRAWSTHHPTRHVHIAWSCPFNSGWYAGVRWRMNACCPAASQLLTHMCCRACCVVEHCRPSISGLLSVLPVTNDVCRHPAMQSWG